MWRSSWCYWLIHESRGRIPSGKQRCFEELCVMEGFNGVRVGQGMAGKRKALFQARSSTFWGKGIWQGFYQADYLTSVNQEISGWLTVQRSHFWGGPWALLVGMHTEQPQWTVRRFLKKLKIELPYDSVIPLLGIYLKKPKKLTWKNICTPMFTAALFTITKIWEQPKSPSTHKW